ncbi:MAG: 4Fe-4S dicluster domain-containing protein [Bacteroidetes bacterium]|nr:4Fe-4S dicluster domain-containing protein [Bacteroidota bacterium]
MKQLHERAHELLEQKAVSVIIGYGEGTEGRVRPVFIRTLEAVRLLVWDDRCRVNLAVYLNKPEIRKFGFPIAVVSTPATVRTIVQLIAEHQLSIGDVVVLVRENDTVRALIQKEDLEQYARNNPVIFPPFVIEEIELLKKMSIEERFTYWQEELAKCFKCYACRAACPLCYCEKCITDVNQPQWVCVAPHPVGVFEWHINRAMHLAGRCIECGSCTIACPVGIPIALLTIEATRVVKEEFAFTPGIDCNAPSALSTFRVDDKETFIR